MPKIIGAFDYSGIDYLDKRKKWNSLAELKAQNTILFPNGFECWCEKEKSKYVLSTTNANDISTYIWKKIEAVGGSFELELNEQYTSDYDISINTKEVSEGYGSIDKNLYEQFATLFKNMQSVIDAQQTKINDLEARVFALEQGSIIKPPIIDDSTSIVDYNGDILADYDGNALSDYSNNQSDINYIALTDYDGDTLVDYDGNALGDYSDTSSDTSTVNQLADYDGDILIDYDGNILSDYITTETTAYTQITDYNGNAIVDYDDNTLTDYDTTNVVYLSDYLNNSLVDYDNNYLIEKEG